MASLEEYTLARDSIHNVEGLRRDMRRNAAGYKSDVASARLTVVQAAEIMGQDAREYLRRLSWQDRVDTPGSLRVKLGNGFAVLGVVLAEVRLAVNEMRAAAEALRDASKATAAEINTTADAVLARVAAHETVW